jgi:hypothetical protein
LRVLLKNFIWKTGLLFLQKAITLSVAIAAKMIAVIVLMDSGESYESPDKIYCDVHNTDML